MTDDSLQSFVNVKPVIVADAPEAHQVRLDAGCQHFTIGEYCETKEQAEWLAAQLRIALTTLQSGAGDAQVVPAGWALVPIEPSWDMRNEGREFLIDGLEKDPEKLAYFLWKTMVKASPLPPQPKGDRYGH